MMPKLIALARRRTSPGMPFDRHAEHFRRRHGVNVEAVANALRQRRDVGDLRRAAAARSASSRPRSACGPASAMKARRILRPSSVRTGMFCRFGSDDESRPVVRRRQRVAGVDAVGLRIDVARQRVGVGRLELRDLPPFENLAAAARGPARRARRARRRRSTTRRSWSWCRPASPILPNRMSPSCLGSRD